MGPEQLSYFEGAESRFTSANYFVLLDLLINESLRVWDTLRQLKASIIDFLISFLRYTVEKVAVGFSSFKKKNLLAVKLTSLPSFRF